MVTPDGDRPCDCFSVDGFALPAKAHVAEPALAVEGPGRVQTMAAVAKAGVCDFPRRPFDPDLAPHGQGAGEFREKTPAPPL